MVLFRLVKTALLIVGGPINLIRKTSTVFFFGGFSALRRSLDFVQNRVEDTPSSPIRFENLGQIPWLNDLLTQTAQHEEALNLVPLDRRQGDLIYWPIEEEGTRIFRRVLGQVALNAINVTYIVDLKDMDNKATLSRLKRAAAGASGVHTLVLGTWSDLTKPPKWAGKVPVTLIRTRFITQEHFEKTLIQILLAIQPREVVASAEGSVASTLIKYKKVLLLNSELNLELSS